MHFEMIAFDADDTLWQSETFYQDAHEAFVTLLAPYGIQRETALEILHRNDIANLPIFGFGIKSFVLSMIEAAVEATAGAVSGSDISAIIALGRAMTGHDIHLIGSAAETVSKLAQTHPLMVITKGDLMDQERKMAASGLAEFFHHVEIVKEKTEEAYSLLLHRHGISPERFLMIGNSMRSDILPVLNLGSWAVYVPHPLTWAHEAASHPEEHGKFYEITSLDQLPDLILKIETGTG
jgi:putative hydrolase of the HAD superfamily